MADSTKQSLDQTFSTYISSSIYTTSTALMIPPVDHHHHSHHQSNKKQQSKKHQRHSRHYHISDSDSGGSLRSASRVEISSPTEIERLRSSSENLYEEPDSHTATIPRSLPLSKSNNDALLSSLSRHSRGVDKPKEESEINKACSRSKDGEEEGCCLGVSSWTCYLLFVSFLSVIIVAAVVLTGYLIFVPSTAVSIPHSGQQQPTKVRPKAVNHPYL